MLMDSNRKMFVGMKTLVEGQENSERLAFYRPELTRDNPMLYGSALLLPQTASNWQRTVEDLSGIH